MTSLYDNISKFARAIEIWRREDRNEGGGLYEGVADVRRALPRRSVDVILGLNASDRHLPEIADLIAPFGHFGLIDDAKGADFHLRQAHLKLESGRACGKIMLADVSDLSRHFV